MGVNLNLAEDLAVYRGVIDHIARFWPDNPNRLMRWGRGPIRERVSKFVVWEIAPKPGEREWAYVSLGAWEASRAEPCAHEFVIVAPEQDPIHVESLAMATYLHLEAEHRLHIGRVVPIGRGWVDGSPMDHFLVSLPYPFGPKLEVCNTAPRPIRILWLMPIHPSEAAYVRTHGAESLEQLFDDAKVEYADPQRPPVV